MSETTYTLDRFRPSIHYAAARTWLNDPNGLIHHGGKFHLYYQNNPFGSGHENLSWGHATSEDLIMWAEQPVAIPCDDAEDIFSGSVVFDQNNDSGFGTVDNPPLVAVYTSAYKAGSPLDGIQAQSLAYSLDGGYTWTKHVENPVLNRNSPDFRDPKVFRYEGPSGAYWILIAAEAKLQEVVLYRSTDLKTWTFLSNFGPANCTGGIWECPDLFKLPLDGNLDSRKWILTVNMNPGGPNGGSGGQYFVGTFDGTTFTSETTVTDGPQDPSRLEDYQWLDWGRDYYAAVSFNDVPDGRRIMIAWMNNWDYARSIPTSPWRSPMSLPREIELITVNGAPRLRQSPVRELAPQAAPVVSLEQHQINEETVVLTTTTGACLISAEFTPVTAADFGLLVHGNGDCETRIGFDTSSGHLILDRTKSGETDFHPTFASTEKAPIEAVGGKYRVNVYLDRCSVEVFAQDGTVTLTDLVFPMEAPGLVGVYSIGGTTLVERLSIHPLNAGTAGH